MENLRGFNILQKNAFIAAKELNDDSVNLLITSPPYNIGKVYEKRTTLEDYLSQYKEFAKTMYDKISPNGSICWEVGNYVEDGEVFPLDIYFYDIFKDAGFKLRNRIIWHFNHGLHCKNRFSGRYETILWFTKSDEYTFNLDSVRVPAKYPGKLHFKGDKKGQPSGNPLGKNPSDFWEAIENDWSKLTWNIPNVKSNHPEKTIHPCQFPVELVERCILALTNEGDTVLDPFMGVGSTIIASLMHNRNPVGFELDSAYIQCTNDRVKELQNGILRVRPLGKPVYVPTGREKVSQVPDSWLQTTSI